MSGGFFRVMSIPECSDIALGPLSRRELKALRMTCKAMAELAGSPACHLFSRVYVSAYCKDLEVLTALATHPTLAGCVRKLVWDTSMTPDRWLCSTSDDSQATDALHRVDEIVGSYKRSIGKGMDYRVLLDALPRFPRLRNVILTELMSRWLPLNHSAQKAEGLQCSHNYHWPFQSPSMRELQQLGVSPSYREEWLAPSAPVSWMPPLMDEITLVSWTEELISGSESVGPCDVLQSLVQYTHRAPFLLLMAIDALDIRLESYSIMDAFVHERPNTLTVSDHAFICHTKHDLRYGSAIALGLSAMVASLSRLSLHLKIRNRFKERLRELLDCARQLKVLHLAFVDCRVAVDDCLLPSLPRLKHVGLENIRLHQEIMTTVLMPWAFTTKLETLHLVNCRFVLPPHLDELGLFSWLVGHDIREPRPYIPANIEADIDPDWVEYFDWDGYIQSETSNAGILGPMDEDMNSDSTGDLVYYESSDTPPVEHEFPMSRLNADEARVIPVVTGENIELVYSGESWGCEAATLRFLVDNFITRDS